MVDGVTGGLSAFPMQPKLSDTPREPFTRLAGGNGKTMPEQVMKHVLKPVARSPIAPWDAPAGSRGPAAADNSLRTVARDMAAAPPVDSRRVAALKADIEAGRYRVEPDRLTAAMLRDIKA